MEVPRINLGLNDVLALWGGITGTISLTFTYLTFWRDRSNIKVKVAKDWIVKGYAPEYDPDETYLSVDALNKGRRPVTITKAGYVFLRKNGGAILADSMKIGPVELTEGKSVSYLAVQKSIDFNEIAYFAVYDAIGNEYKKWVTSKPRFFYFWIADKFGFIKRGSVHGTEKE